MGLISTLMNCDDDGESKCVNGNNDGGNDDNDGHQYRQD